MRYLFLPVLLTILCLTGFTSQVQANDNVLVSLEHGGSADVIGSRIFDVYVCNDFEVEFWVRDLPESMVALTVAITWDPELMELQNVKLNLPTEWGVYREAIEGTDSWFIGLSGESFLSNWKWITFTFHCKGEGSSPINIPMYYTFPGEDMSDIVSIGPWAIGHGIPRTYLKASVTQIDATVGGITIPINKLEMLTPYLSLAGLIAVVSTIFIMRRRKD